MIVQPNFSDPKIAPLFGRDIHANEHIHYVNDFKNEYFISIYVDTIDVGFILSFYQNSTRLGVIKYYSVKNPNGIGYVINNAEYFLLEQASKPSFGDSGVTQDVFREWLINTPEYAEWSIWNHV
jgi:hypothetical protein